MVQPTARPLKQSSERIGEAKAGKGWYLFAHSEEDHSH